LKYHKIVLNTLLKYLFICYLLIVLQLVLVKSVSNEEIEIPKLPKNEINTLLENESSTNKEFCIYAEKIWSEWLILTMLILVTIQ